MDMNTIDKLDSENVTVIICSAGMGTRFGHGIPKALIDIDGKPLILHQLALFENYDDVRVVVGFKHQQVISVIKEYRDDVKCYINNDYMNTGAAASVIAGMADDCRDYVIALVGDVLIRPQFMDKIINYQGECISVCELSTDNPIEVIVDHNAQVVEINSENISGNYEWLGIVKVLKQHINKSSRGALYQMIKPLLPMDVVVVNAKEIDTPNDLIKAIEWLE